MLNGDKFVWATSGLLITMAIRVFLLEMVIDAIWCIDTMFHPMFPFIMWRREGSGELRKTKTTEITSKRAEGSPKKGGQQTAQLHLVWQGKLVDGTPKHGPPTLQLMHENCISDTYKSNNLSAACWNDMKMGNPEGMKKQAMRSASACMLSMNRMFVEVSLLWLWWFESLSPYCYPRVNTQILTKTRLLPNTTNQTSSFFTWSHTFIGLICRIHSIMRQVEVDALVIIPPSQ